jgi:hypothetical protein
MTRVIFCLLIICGVAVAVQPPLHEAHVVAVWSDFKAFGAKVSALDNADVIWSMGGEDDTENFDDLLDKLWELQSHGKSVMLGFVIFSLSSLGLILDIARGRTANNVAKTTERASP